MTRPSVGPATQSTGNVAGGPYGAWFDSAGNALIGPTGNPVSLFTGAAGGVALYDGANSITSGTAVFSNFNGVSFGFNGQTITGSVATAAQSVQTQASGAIAGSGFTSTTTAGTAVVGTNNSGGLSLAVPKYITGFTQSNQTGISSIADSANTQTIGMLSFANSNGITFGISTGNLTATITASAATATPGLSSAADSAATQTIGMISFANSNGITFGLSTGANTGTFTGSVQTNYAGTGSTFAGTHVSASITYNTAGLNLALSGAAGPADLSYYEMSPLRGALTFMNAGSQTGTLFLQPFVVAGQPVSAYRGMLLANNTSNTSTYSATIGVSQSQQSTTYTATWSQAFTYGLLSRVSTGTNANSANIVTFTTVSASRSGGISQTFSCATAVSTGSVTATVSYGIGFLNNIDSAGGVTTSSTGSSYSSSGTATTNAASTFSTTFGGSQQFIYLTGIRPLDFPMAVSLSPGEYWFGYQFNSGGAGQANCIHLSGGQVQLFGASSISSFIFYGSSSATTYVQQGWGGLGTANTSTTFPLTNIQPVTGYQIWFNLMAATL